MFPAAWMRPRSSRQKKRSAVALVFACAVALGGCGGGSGSGSGGGGGTVTVSVSPSSITVPVHKSQTFTATVSGTSNPAVTWSVNGTQGGNNTVGTIDQFGDYVANQVPSPATVTITATSVADPSKSAHATATIVLNAGTAATQTPPVKMGTSGGNAADSQTSGNKVTCCGGTLGGLLQRNGVFYVLSANHVLARSNAAAVGDAIVQPGLDDNNCTAGQTVARLSEFADLRSSNVDAAIAAIVPGQVDTSGSILALGTANSSSIAAAPPSATLAVPATVLASNEGVGKVGSATGLTCSVITSINTSVKVDYSQTCGGSTSLSSTFTNQLVIQGASFSASGDSGALIVTTDTARPVGLLYAGNTTSSTANPIQDVLNAFQGPPTVVGGGDHAVSCAPNASDQVASGQVTSAVAQARNIQLSADEMQRAEIVRQRHQPELMANPAVASVEVRTSGDNPMQAAVEVHLSQPSQTTIPPQLEGVRTRVVRDFNAEDLAVAPERLEQKLPAAANIKQAHAPELLQQEGIYAVGVGRSEDDPAEAAIVIYGERTALAAIPATLDGVRTRLIQGDRYTATWGKREKTKAKACPVPKKKN